MRNLRNVKIPRRADPKSDSTAVQREGALAAPKEGAGGEYLLSGEGDSRAYVSPKSSGCPLCVLGSATKRGAIRASEPGSPLGPVS
jgi:hypothetical protein